MLGAWNLCLRWGKPFESFEYYVKLKKMMMFFANIYKKLVLTNTLVLRSSSSSAC